MLSEDQRLTFVLGAVPKLSRLAGVSEASRAGVRRRNPERSAGKRGVEGSAVNLSWV